MRSFLTSCLAISLLCTAYSAAASPQQVSVKVRYAISHIPYNQVTISCGTFTGGIPPHMPGSRPLTHAWKVPTAPSGTVTMSVALTPATFWIGCWPSTSVPMGFNMARTMPKMVVASVDSPLPKTLKPVSFLTGLTIVGKGP